MLRIRLISDFMYNTYDTIQFGIWYFDTWYFGTWYLVSGIWYLVFGTRMAGEATCRNGEIYRIFTFLIVFQFFHR